MKRQDEEADINSPAFFILKKETDIQSRYLPLSMQKEKGILDLSIPFFLKSCNKK